MKKQITRISLFQTAKVIAGIYLLISLPLLVPLVLLTPLLSTGAVGIGAFALWPLAYALVAFLMTLLGGALYNLVARFAGGIEFVTEEVIVETPSY